MKRTIDGEHHDLMVEGELTVNGAVRGVTVPSGCHLTVNGALDGTVQVEEGATLVVFGTLTPTSVANDGMLMVGGVAMVKIGDLDDLGYFALSPGSLVGDGDQQIQPDGSLLPLDAGRSHDVKIDGNVWCAWIRSDQRFVPMAELKRQSPES